MEVTIYSNCRLSKSYNEVINHNYLEDYLSSLNKSIMNINYTYLTSTGRLPIDLEPLGINYLEGNYMKKVDSYNNITRYYFIDSLEIVNGTAVIYYSEDVWSNYGHKVNIVKGNVSNLRYGIGNSPKFLPNEYLSNDKFVLNKINRDNLGKYCLIFEISFYNLVEGGTSNVRYNRTFVVTNSTYDAVEEFTLNSVFDYIDAVVSETSNKDIFEIKTSPIQKYSCEIVNAYIIPKEYYDLLNLNFGFGLNYEINGTYLKVLNTGEYSYNFTLDNNYKRYAIGTLDNFIITDENGSSTNCEFIAINDVMRFRLLLKVSTNIIDITPSFNYQIPISVQSADVTQQQAISRQLQNNMLDIDRENIIAKSISGSIRSIGDVVGSAVSTSRTGKIKGITEGIASGIDTAREVSLGIQKNDLNRWYVNYKAYKTNSSVNTKRNIYLSLLYGLIDFTIIPDNEDYINALIETIGYNVLMITNDNSLIEQKQENQDYNIVKFSNVWLYGNVTHDIQSILEEILEKGIKIWFKSNV